MKKAFQLRVFYPDDHEHHVWVFRLLMPSEDSIWHDQCCAFTFHGYSHASLPWFEWAAARMFFMLVNDGWVEGFHAVIHRPLQYKRHYSQPMVGLALHGYEINAILTEDAQNVTVLAKPLLQCL